MVKYLYSYLNLEEDTIRRYSSKMIQSMNFTNKTEKYTEKYQNTLEYINEEFNIDDEEESKFNFPHSIASKDVFYTNNASSSKKSFINTESSKTMSSLLKRRKSNFSKNTSEGYYGLECKCRRPGNAYQIKKKLIDEKERKRKSFRNNKRIFQSDSSENSSNENRKSDHGFKDEILKNYTYYYPHNNCESIIKNNRKKNLYDQQFLISSPFAKLFNKRRKKSNTRKSIRTEKKKSVKHIKNVFLFKNIVNKIIHNIKIGELKRKLKKLMTKHIFQQRSKSLDHIHDNKKFFNEHYQLITNKIDFPSFGIKKIFIKNN